MASREAGTGPPEAAGTVVLLVDDEPDVASVTAVHLERHLSDVSVVTVSGGTEALERFSEDVDCVVSDYEMPRMDGLTLLRRVRDRDPDLPFVLFTARGSEEIASEAISAGVTDYLQKGVGTDQYAVLANRIENAVARRRSEAAAAETRSRYRQLVEHSPNAILVHDGESILYANERVATLTGVETPEALYGEPPIEYVHPDDRAWVRRRIGTVFADRQTTDWGEYRILREDGDVRHVESRGAPVRYDGQSASQVVLRDLTDIHERERRLESLHEATRELHGAETPGEVAAVVLDTVAEVFDEPIAAIWEYDPSAGRLVPLDASPQARELGEEDGLEDGTGPLPRESVEMAVFDAGEPRLVTDYSSHADAVTDHFETVYMYPLAGHGLVNVATTPARTFADAELDLLGILGRTVTAALDRVVTDSGG